MGRYSRSTSVGWVLGPGCSFVAPGIDLLRTEPDLAADVVVGYPELLDEPADAPRRDADALCRCPRVDERRAEPGWMFCGWVFVSVFHVHLWAAEFSDWDRSAGEIANDS